MYIYIYVYIYIYRACLRGSGIWGLEKAEGLWIHLSRPLVTPRTPHPENPIPLN